LERIFFWYGVGLIHPTMGTFLMIQYWLYDTSTVLRTNYESRSLLTYQGVGKMRPVRLRLVRLTQRVLCV